MTTETKAMRNAWRVERVDGSGAWVSSYQSLTRGAAMKQFDKMTRASDAANDGGRVTLTRIRIPAHHSLIRTKRGAA